MVFGNREGKILHNKVMGKGGKIKIERQPPECPLMAYFQGIFLI